MNKKLTDRAIEENPSKVAKRLLVMAEDLKENHPDEGKYYEFYLRAKNVDMKNIEVYGKNGDKNVPEYNKVIKLLDENIEKYLGGNQK
tara:strand:+ start:456 stop:719 length:264 start_codon:yes stop_codon:yes gene_type:complete